MFGGLFGGSSPAKKYGYKPEAADDQLATLESQHDRWQIVPYKDDGGIDPGIEFLESIHKTEGKLRNNSTPRVMEIWYREGRIEFYWLPLDQEEMAWFGNRLETKYRNSDTALLGPDFIEIGPEDYVAGGSFELKRHRFYPIRRYDTDGFREDDPYESVLTDIVDSGATTHIPGQPSQDRDQVRTVIQVLLRPRGGRWTTANLLSTNLKDSWFALNDIHGLHDLGEEHRERGSKDDRDLGNVLSRRATEKSYEVEIRFLSVCNDEEAVAAHARHLADSFESYYNSYAEQGLKPVSSPAPRRLARQMIQREWSGDSTILTTVEAGGIAHCPLYDIGIPDIEFATTKDAGSAPADAPRFDEFDSEGKATPTGDETAQADAKSSSSASED